jgi:hypothetical protein
MDANKIRLIMDELRDGVGELDCRFEHGAEESVIAHQIGRIIGLLVSLTVEIGK